MKRSFRVATWILISCLAVGLLRGLLQVAVRPDLSGRLLHVCVATISMTLLWFPISALQFATWRFAERRLHFVASNIALLGLAVFFEPLWINIVIGALGGRHAPYLSQWFSRFDTNVLSYALVVGVFWSVLQARRANDMRVRAAQIERAVADAQLHVLSLQLQPHFLFNTLNVISQLAYEDANAARSVLTSLENLLEESMAAAEPGGVTLREELRFLDAYVAIQRWRFRDGLVIDVDAAGDVLDARVPPLILQPLVENAIVHGMQDLESGRVHVRVSVARHEHRLRMSVTDDGPGVSIHRMQDGIGLRNTRSRLEQLFQGDCSLILRERSLGGAEVVIDAPWITTVQGSQNVDALLQDSERMADAPKRFANVGPRRIMIATLAGCAVAVVTWTEMEALSSFLQRDGVGTLSDAWVSNAFSAMPWLVLAPLGIWIARRYHVAGRHRVRHGLLHVAVAVGFAITQAGVWMFMLRLVNSPNYSAAKSSVNGWIVWDVIAYCGILAFTTAYVFGEGKRDAAIAIVREQSNLARARLSLLRVRLQPAVLFSGLGAVRSTIADPERCERTITRLGDLLRSLLTHAESDTTTLADEVATIDAYRSTMSHGESHDSFNVPVEFSDVEMPGAILAPIAAEMGGTVTDLNIRGTVSGLIVEILFSHACMDVSAVRTRLSSIDTRLRALYGAAGVLRVERISSTEMIVGLEVPAT